MQPWSYPLIERRKAEIKQHLDAATAAHGVGYRLQEIQKSIRDLAELDSAESARDRYIYVLSALVHQLRYGGLKERDVQGLENLAFAILEAQGIRPGVSRISFLYGEIHQVKSQLAQKEGRFWEAAWEVQISHRLGRPEPEHSGFQNMSAGLRCLRTGNAQIALQFFEAAETKNLNEANFLRNRLGWLQALRYSGDLTDADELQAATERDCAQSPRFVAELGWERICRGVASGAPVSSLVRSTRKGQAYAAAEYALEAKLWAFASRERNLVDVLPKGLSLKRRGPGALSKQTAVLARAVTLLEDCYDKDVAFAHRLRSLMLVKDLGQKLATFDKEMLLWLGSARWLERSQCLALARMAFEEYRVLSLRATAGRSADGLRMADDLQRRLEKSSGDDVDSSVTTR